MRGESLDSMRRLLQADTSVHEAIVIADQENTVNVRPRGLDQ